MSGPGNPNPKRCAKCGGIGVPKNDSLCKACRLERDQGPEAKEKYLRNLGAKGGHANRKDPPGLQCGTLGPLEDHADAKRWLERIGRAVATNRLGTHQASVAIRAVSEWVSAHEGELTVRVIDELEAEVEQLKAEMGRGPRLIEGAQ